MTPLIPFPLFDYSALFKLFLPVMGFCCAVGLMVQLREAGSPQDRLMVIVRAATLMAFLAYFDPLVQATKGTVDSIVRNELKASPEQTLMNFATKMMALDRESSGSSLWDKLTKTSEVMYHAFLVGMITFVVIVSFAIYFLAYLAQEFALEFGIAFSPFMVGFLFFGSTRSIGVKYLLYMLAIALFPLGWGAASVVSERLIDVATAHQLVTVSDPDAHSLSTAFRTLLASLLLAIWLLLSTVVSPFAIVRLITSGVPIQGDPLVQVAKKYLRF